MTIRADHQALPSAGTLSALPRQRPAEEAPRRFRFDVAVIGLGSVGLPTVLSFHAAGQRVLGIDVKPSRLEAIRRCTVDLLATDQDRLATALVSHRLLLDTDGGYLKDAAAVLICVPTPVDSHQVPDLSMLKAACRTVVAHAVAGQTLILTSTTYVGSTEELLGEPLRARGLQPGEDVFVAFSPEQFDPGSASYAQEKVPRLVGGLTAACSEQAGKVLAESNVRINELSSAEAAEFTKLYENTFQAVNLAYANEMSTAAQSLGVDIDEVIAATSTKLPGFLPFRPGPGVGGHSIPCDPHYLLWQLNERRRPLPLVAAAMSLIAQRPLDVVRRITETLAAAGKLVAGSEILVAGIAYKPDVSDVRESPALVILDELRAAGARVSYLDPHVTAVRLPSGFLMHSVGEPAPTQPDLVLLHTAHSETCYDWLSSKTVLLNATGRRVMTSATQIGL